MTTHFNGLSEAEQERLAILIEECGEVIQAGCKILRHGYETTNPHKKTSPINETNREALERELGDLFHAVHRLKDAADVNGEKIGARAFSKPAHIAPYLHHQNAQD